MAYRYSQPVETLIEKAPAGGVDVLVVGSGYGGAIAAYRLANAHARRSVYVLERGREYAPGEFPRDIGDAPGHMQFRRPNDEHGIGYPDGLFDFRFGDDVDVLVGSGLGGTSLINANVALRPKDEIFNRPAWPRAIAHDIAAPDSLLKKGFNEVERLLGTSKVAGTQKYAAFERLARGCGATAELVPIAVTSPAQPCRDAGEGSVINAAGIAQSPCTLCGNCVSGCNVGAKNTLDRNFIPLAKARGACFYTGATVLTVGADATGARRWSVRFRRTVTEKTPLETEVYTIAADVVILAAGTLGSSEILMRSRDAALITCSDQLGKRFSTNGDALAMSYGQARSVNALAKTTGACSDVGPTITGFFQTAVLDEASGESVRLNFEDAAVPYALTRVFGEIATTGAFFQRLGNDALPAWHRNHDKVDPLAVNRDALAHSQVLLVMGDDGAKGTLQLATPHRTPQALDRARVRVVWPGAAKNPALMKAHDLLGRAGRGFDGGQYVPNPAWRLLPDGAENIMSGAELGGRVMTVHPLGGCAMADSPATGAVNDRGAVFTGSASPLVHKGLYVLDGSIVPEALAINPFMTIAALSWRAASLMLQDYGWQESESVPVPAERVEPHGQAGKIQTLTLVGRHETGQVVSSVVRPGPVAPNMAPLPTAVDLHEQLLGHLRYPADKLGKVFGDAAKKWAKPFGLVVQIRMPIPDVEKWLDNPGVTPIDATASFCANLVDPDDMLRFRSRHVPRDHGAFKIFDATGKVHLLQPDRRDTTKRTVKALWTYYRRRGFSTGGEGPIWERLKKLTLVGRMHAVYRTMSYQFDGRVNGYRVRISGEKRIAWNTDNPRLWEALIELPFNLQVTGGDESVKIAGELVADLQDMSSGGLPQVRRESHLPQALIATGGIGLFFCRAFLQTSFWEFGAPEYPKRPVKREHAPRVLRLSNGTSVSPEPELSLPVRVSAHDAGPIDIRLTRYRRDGAKPVLLLHGLAQSSLIFTIEGMTQTMAAAAYEAGYDVWLLDYRLSARLLHIHVGDWSIEEIAQFDVPRALDYVYEASAEQPVRIFAHCVGATAITMSVLGGWTRSDRIEAVALNAIHPWIDTSVANRVRALLGSGFRELVGTDLLDPIPEPNPSMAQTVLDRLGYSLARVGEAEQGIYKHIGAEADDLEQAICDRMTFLFGRMWRHDNLEPAAHEAFKDILGPAHGETYRQLYYFSRRGRTTDREGQNVFLTRANIKSRWTFRTFFMHGEQSGVFNPQSATESAVRMAIVHGDGKVSEEGRKQFLMRRFEGFGHMCIVFGERAAAEVYPCLMSFFGHDASKPPLPCSQPYDQHSSRHLDIWRTSPTGPMLRAAWIDGDTIRLRFLVELADAVTLPLCGVQVTGPVLDTQQWKVRGSEPRYRLVDVAVSASTPEVELVVLPAVEPSTMQMLTSKQLVPALTATTIMTLDPDPIPPAMAFGATGTLRPDGVWPPKAAKFNKEMPYCVGLGPEHAWWERIRARASTRRPADSMAFLVGSCRYPGTAFETELSDAVFKGMAEQVKGAAGVDLCFFVGDQIYADATADLFDSNAWRERYSERYRAAFTSPHMRELLRMVPTHFAVDDHEFDDNWEGLRRVGSSPADRERRRRHGLARMAARSYQTSGRRPFGKPGPSRGSALWYPLAHDTECAFPTFVMDTRSERELRVAGIAGLQARLTRNAQWNSLKTWLLDAHAHRRCDPKFIISGSVVAPFSRELCAYPELWRRQDGWAGYPAALAELAALIVDNRIPNVVFIGGDLHLSAAASLELSTPNGTASAWQIVSSGLYSPLPFANTSPDIFDWTKPCTYELPIGNVSITADAGMLLSGEPHFVRVDFGPETGNRLRVAAYGADGGRRVPLGPPPSAARVDADAWLVPVECVPEIVTSPEEPAPA